MVTHSGILAWRIPWTKEPDRLQSMGLQRLGHDKRHLACMDRGSTDSLGQGVPKSEADLKLLSVTPSLKFLSLDPASCRPWFALRA